VCTSFPSFKLADFGKVCSVTEFKYLGHLKHNTLCDDLDIEREVKNLFVIEKIP